MTDEPIHIDVSRVKKETYLKELTEDDFRDRVVHPLMRLRGLQLLRDTCGVTEEGKDSLYRGTDPLGRQMIYAIQTKRGDLKLTRKARDNVVEATTQLKTALETDIYLTTTKSRLKPSVVILCASGSMNDAARRHIVENITDTRLDFLDANDLIPMIDELYPEFWHGVEANKFPYFRALRLHLLKLVDVVDMVPDDTTERSPISDEGYVELYASRVIVEPVRRHGQVEQEPKYDQVATQKLLDRRESLVWITGEGGSGKTTVLRRMAFHIAGKALFR